MPRPRRIRLAPPTRAVALIALLCTLRAVGPRQATLAFGRVAQSPPSIARLEPTEASVRRLPAALRAQLRDNLYDYFRFVNAQWMQAMCDRFADARTGLPNVGLHGDPHIEQYAFTADSRGLDDFDDSTLGPFVVPAMATGEFEFVHNVRVPGMLHGAVVRPPTVGATLVSIDERSVSDMPGVVRVVAKNNFVGVVAEKPWQAMQAAAKLRVDWTKGTSLPAQRELYDYLRSRPARRDSVLVDSGDVDARLKSAARVMKATFHYPYQMHGSLGSSCAVADVGDVKATLWSATQAVYPMRSTAAMLLGL